MLKFVISIPREQKTREGRVGMTPAGAHHLLEKFSSGLTILVETGAGREAGFLDEDYVAAGAVIAPDVETLYESADLVVKVKEPTPKEYHLLGLMKGKMLFTYLHLAGVDRELTKLLLLHQITAIAYEGVMVEGPMGPVFPLLVPMSIIAGREAVLQAIALYPRKSGIGTLRFVNLGAGNVGQSAVRTEIEQGSCFISVFEPDPKRIEAFSKEFAPYIGRRVFIYPLADMKRKVGKELLAKANIIISGVMLPGGKAAPKVLTEAILRTLSKGTHVMDVAIDQGGSTARSRATPPGEVYEDAGIVFSCTANIPGSTVPREATMALEHETLPYVSDIARHRVRFPSGDFAVLESNIPLRSGLQAYRGLLTNLPVATKHGLLTKYKALDTMFTGK